MIGVNRGRVWGEKGEGGDWVMIWSKGINF